MLRLERQIHIHSSQESGKTTDQYIGKITELDRKHQQQQKKKRKHFHSLTAKRKIAL